MCSLSLSGRAEISLSLLSMAVPFKVFPSSQCPPPMILILLHCLKGTLRHQIVIPRNGYLYIYVSNTNDTYPVYFDDLHMEHIRSLLVEETHYYPFGLPMNGISSKAASFGNPSNKFLLRNVSRHCYLKSTILFPGDIAAFTAVKLNQHPGAPYSSLPYKAPVFLIRNISSPGFVLSRDIAAFTEL